MKRWKTIFANWKSQKGIHKQERRKRGTFQARYTRQEVQKRRKLIIRLTHRENLEIRNYLQGLSETKEAALMKHCIQHGRISTYEHVVSVARLSFYLNRRLHVGAPDSELVRGAFLHDFYLYDWHEGGYPGRLHGLHHPAIALKEASRRYPLTPMERNIILSHMWPLTLFSFPRCRAAFLVCLADKICSAYEVVVQTRSLRC